MGRVVLNSVGSGLLKKEDLNMGRWVFLNDNESGPYTLEMNCISKIMGKG